MGSKSPGTSAEIAGSWSSGASGESANSMFMTAGSTSYSTSIASIASSARCGSFAATAAIGWPLYSTFSLAMTASRVHSMGIGPRIVGMTRCSMCGKSAAVSTACTPGIASAFEVSMLLIRACAWGLRFTRAYSVPTGRASTPYSARPVTLSTPSGRTGRVPTMR